MGPHVVALRRTVGTHPPGAPGGPQRRSCCVFRRIARSRGNVDSPVPVGRSATLTLRSPPAISPSSASISSRASRSRRKLLALILLVAQRAGLSEAERKAYVLKVNEMQRNLSPDQRAVRRSGLIDQPPGATRARTARGEARTGRGGSSGADRRPASPAVGTKGQGSTGRRTALLPRLDVLAACSLRCVAGCGPSSRTDGEGRLAPVGFRSECRRRDQPRRGLTFIAPNRWHPAIASPDWAACRAPQVRRPRENRSARAAGVRCKAGYYRLSGQDRSPSHSGIGRIASRGRG